jgi:hypothetical protein
MYYIAKFLEIVGMAIIGIGFIIKFPTLMDPTILGFGLSFFFMGWIIEKYILKS